MTKRAVRKPDITEKRYVDRIRASRGERIFKDDWPAFAPMVEAGLLAWSPPLGQGKAWRMIAVPEHATW